MVLIIFLSAAYLYYLNFEPDRKLYPIRGIDVSHHQGEIHWDLVRKDDVQFVFIKASEGRDFKDILFFQNWNDAKKYNIPHGAYHFFSLCVSGQEQAKNFIETVPVEPNTLPPVVDLEFGGNCKNHPSQAEFLQQLRAYTNAIEKHYQRKPILYVTQKFFSEYLLPEKSLQNSTGHFEFPLWVRGIVFKPSDKMGWSFWQYHDRGRVDGIEKPVDLNVLMKGERLDKWLR